MRVGIVTGEYPPMQGGIGAYTRILADELNHQGADVSIFTSQQALSTGTSIPITNKIKSWGMSSLLMINKWASAYRADVVNIQFQTAAYGMSPWIHFLPDLMRIPIVTTFHDLRHPYLFPKAGALRDWVVMHLAQTSAGVIVTNHEDYERLEHIRYKSLIPIGSNIQQPLPDDFDAAKWRTKIGATANDFLIAYFGLFNQTKGLETLLGSVADLHANGAAVRLVMVGGGLGSGDPTNAAYFDSLRVQIQQLGIEPLIYWTGYLEDESEVGAYLTASDAVALPFADGASYRRGSLMAAIQYGCAIVSTLPTIKISTFQSGDNMLLVPRGDRTALAHAFHQVRQSPELQARLRQGAAKLREQFDWTKITQDTLSLFEQARKHGNEP